MVRENDSISDSDLYHVFKKVDIDNSQEITATVQYFTIQVGIKDQCSGWIIVLGPG